MIHDVPLQSRAEFYLCLAHAFLTPDSETAWRALRDALADDLDELDDELDLEAAAHIDDYRRAIAAFPDHAALLQRYSALFVAPPRTVSLNTGSYLDGALNGGSVLAMELAYRNAGLERKGAFRDLSDHLSVQLEFVASRYLAQASGHIATDEASVAAASFLARFVAPALPALIADLDRAGAAANPWLALAHMLRLAVKRDAHPAGAVAGPSRRQTALDKARHDRAASSIGADELAFIAQRLSERGLATGHLIVAPEQRDEARGWTRRVPPSPRRR